MSRIASCLAQLKKEKIKALVPYVVVGDPNIELCVPMMHALVDGGANIIELGIPFSDPMAEGPTIQKAHERALLSNTSLKDTLAVVKNFRARDTNTPVVLMGYANPIEVMGYEKFAESAYQAGVDGVLIVDMPPEEASSLIVALRKYSLDNIFLIAPTTTENRIRLIAKNATGYLYYVSLKGVTGAGNLDLQSVQDKMAIIKSITDLPICIGFGIKDAESATQIAKTGDGVVVGSALVDKISAAKNNIVALETTKVFLQSIRTAIDK